LVGGSASTALCETSQGFSTNWCQLQPQNAPAARKSPVMAADPVANRLILFGGADSNGAMYGDTWQWTGSNWSRLSPATSPPARWAATMALDPQTGHLMLFGGYGQTGDLNDTWEWTGTTWQQITPTGGVSPPVREFAEMAV